MSHSFFSSDFFSAVGLLHPLVFCFVNSFLSLILVTIPKISTPQILSKHKLFRNRLILPAVSKIDFTT